jgi:hypothetical protein
MKKDKVQAQRHYDRQMIEDFFNHLRCEEQAEYAEHSGQPVDRLLEKRILEYRRRYGQQLVLKTELNIRGVQTGGWGPQMQENFRKGRQDYAARVLDAIAVVQSAVNWALYWGNTVTGSEITVRETWKRAEEDRGAASSERLHPEL